jgi:hypothetical protein
MPLPHNRDVEGPLDGTRQTWTLGTIQGLNVLPSSPGATVLPETFSPRKSQTFPQNAMHAVLGFLRNPLPSRSS